MALFIEYKKKIFRIDRIHVFVIDPEEEKKKKEEEDKKTLKEMIKKYREEIKKEKENLNKKEEKEKLEAPKINYPKGWIGRFAKCMTPALATIGVGIGLWASGEFVKWVSTMAEFTKGIHLEGSVVGIIKTSSFWKITGALAAGGLVVFCIWRLAAVANDALASAKKQNDKTSKDLKHSKEIEKTQNMSIDDEETELEAGKSSKKHANKSITQYLLQNEKNISNQNVYLNKYIRNHAVSKTKNYKKYTNHNAQKRNKAVYTNYKKTKCSYRQY